VLLLARTFGYVNPDEMLDKISPDQFQEWLDEYYLEPWGPAADWQRSGTIAASVHNSFEQYVLPLIMGLAGKSHYTTTYHNPSDYIPTESGRTNKPGKRIGAGIAELMQFVRGVADGNNRDA
jgi:hypothetical protein